MAKSDMHRDVVSLIPALRAFARRFYRDDSDVEDLVQDTLVKALSAANSFQENTNLKSWLFTILRNTHHTTYIRRKREVVGIEHPDLFCGFVAPPQEWVIRAKEFRIAVDAMPMPHREAFDLVLGEGQSYESAAHQCNVAIGTIKSRVSRARHFLANRLGDEVNTAASI